MLYSTLVPCCDKNVCAVLLYLQLFVGGFMSNLPNLCLFTNSGVQYILCCVFLRLVYPMLPVSLDCQFLIVPSVFSKVYLEQRCSDYKDEICYILPSPQDIPVHPKWQWHMKFSVPLFSQSPLTHKSSIRSHSPEYKQHKKSFLWKTVCDKSSLRLRSLKYKQEKKSHFYGNLRC